MADRSARIVIVGDAKSFLGAMARSSAAVKRFSETLALSGKQTSIGGAQAAAAQARYNAAIAREIEKTKNAQKKAETEAASATKKTSAATASGRQAFYQYGKEVRKAREELGKHNIQQGRLFRGALAGAGAFTSLGRSIAYASASFLAFAVLSGAVRGAVASVAQFEEALSRVVGLAGGTRKEVAKMGEELLRLGPQVGRGPIELAQALYFVASAGIKVSKQLDVVKVSAQAAAAGLGDTQTVADAVTSIMNAYGQENVSAARAVNALVLTVKFGKGEAAEFAPVIGSVAAQAAILGVNIEQVGAALAEMTILQGDAGTASIQLQAYLKNLTFTSKAAKEALRSVGIAPESLADELAKPDGLLNVINLLSDAFRGNASALRAVFPDIRAFRAVSELAGKNIDQTRRIFKGMKNDTTALQVALAAASKDPLQRFRAFQATMQALSITIGSALLPTVLKVSDAITVFLQDPERLDHLQKNIEGVANAFVSLFKAVKAIVMPLAHATNWIAQFAGWNTTLKSALVAVIAIKMATHISAIAAAFALATDRTILLRKQLTLLRAAAIPAIVITVAAEVIINRKEIEKKLQPITDFLNKATGKTSGGILSKIVGPNIHSIKELAGNREAVARIQASRRAFEDIGDTGNLLYKALSGVMDRVAEVWRKNLVRKTREAIKGVGEALTKVAEEFNRAGITSKGGKHIVPSFAPGTPEAFAVRPELLAERARATAVGTKAQQIAAEKQIREYIQALLDAGTMTPQQTESAYNELKQTKDTIAGLLAQAFEIKPGLLLEQAKAAAQGTGSQQRAIAVKIRDYIKAIIDSGKLGTKALTDAYTALKQQNDAIAALAKEAVLVPFELQLAESKAAAIGTVKEQKNVAAKIREAIKKQIATGKLQGEALKNAYDTLANYRKDASKKESDSVKKHAELLRQATEKISDAIDSARSAIGELFHGPLIDPPERIQQIAMGLPIPNIGALTKDLDAQVNLRSKFENMLKRLAGRGAPDKLISELRDKGIEALPEVESLLKAKLPQLRKFFEVFAKREDLAKKIALIELRAQHVNLVAHNIALTLSKGELKKFVNEDIFPQRRLGTTSGGGGGAGLSRTLMARNLHVATQTSRNFRATTMHANNVSFGGRSLSSLLAKIADKNEVIHIHVNLDGNQIEEVVTDRQQRRNRRSGSQRRGRHGGQTASG